MSQWFKLLISVCVICSVLPCVFSIKCWHCRSSNDPKCADPFDNSTVPITDCKQEMCRKIRQKVNGMMVISRGCTWKRQDDYGYTCPATQASVNEVTSFCETCDYDGCNGATAIGKTLALLAAPLALLIFK